MREVKPYHAIISAELENNEDNARNTEALKDKLDALGFIYHAVFGCYEGVTEESFLVNLGTDARFHKQNASEVLRLGCLFQQDSLLFIDNEENAELVFCESGEKQNIGTFTCVCEENAKAQAAYTKIGERYFICK